MMDTDPSSRILTGMTLNPNLTARASVLCNREILVRRTMLTQASRAGLIAECRCLECDDIGSDLVPIRPINRPWPALPVRRRPVLSSC